MGGGPLRTIGAIGGRVVNTRLNERGQYRLHNLPPGEYNIRIILRDNKNGNIGSLSAPLKVPEAEASSDSKPAH